MCKVIKLRLSKDENKKISAATVTGHRFISNKMGQIKLNKKLLKKIKSGYNDVKRMKGKLIG